MCQECEKYIGTGAEYCLVCGSPVELKKEAKESEDEGMFKHGSDDLDLEPLEVSD